MPKPQTLMTGLAFGESPRWHDGRLWFSNWTAQEIIAVDPQGKSEVMARVPYPTFPFSIAWLPDGRLLIVSADSDQPLLRQEPDGSLVSHAGLDRGWNEIVVDGRGNTYINGAGFDLLAGEQFAPGIVTLVTPDGSARQVADGIAFPNGMAITPDNATLIVADSYGEKTHCLRHCGRRWPLQPARVGRPRRRRPRRHLHRRRRCRLVRGRSQQALRARSRRWRGATNGQPWPRLLRLHARRRGSENTIHDGRGVAWFR